MTVTACARRVCREVPESVRERFGLIERAVLDHADLSYLPEAEALLAGMPAFSRQALGEEFARCVVFVRDTCGPLLRDACEIPLADPASWQEVRYWYATCTRAFGDCEDA